MTRTGGDAGHQDEEGEDGNSKSSRKPKPGKVERTGKRKRPALPRGSVDDSVVSVCQNIIQIDLGGAERDKETSHNTMLRNLVNIVASRGQARQVPVFDYTNVRSNFNERTTIADYDAIG